MKAFALIFAMLAAPAGAAHNGSFAPESYLVYYGSWGPREIEKAKPFDLIVLHPGEAMRNITPELVKQLRRDGKTKILAYVSIGESKTAPLGPQKAGESGFPSWFLDGDKDGLPDENGRWGSYFVNAGDAKWKENRLSRMRELKRRFGVDGFFLDTLDTASPWGAYGWMQKDMARLVWDIASAFPKEYILANRGLFLLKTYPDLMRPAIDGLMFESFVTEWDWHRKIGVPHPWFRSNTDVLAQDILPAAAKKDGFHLYLLNYIDPAQSDFFNLDADLHASLAGARWTNYYSTPELNTVFPPPETYYGTSTQLPRVTRFSIEEYEKGDFSATVLLKGAERLALGSDYFLDLRYAGERLREDQLPHAQRIPIDSEILTLDDTPGGREARIRYFGLQNFKQYFFYLRVRGRNHTIASPLISRSLITRGGAWPDAPTAVAVEPAESAVALRWKPPGGELRAYQVYLGAHPAQPTLVKTVTEPSARIEGLRNGEVYFFSVAAVGTNGSTSGLSRPVPAVPLPTKGPGTPSGLEVLPGRGSLRVRWNPLKGASGYRVYCRRAGHGPRLPEKVGPEATEFVLEGLERDTAYIVSLTAVNADAIQSAPTTELKIKTR